jgi:acetolactate synthase-1/2/3 large subunit
VWLAIPLDVQAAMIDERRLKGFKPDRRPPKIDREQIKQLVKMLAESQRPVILAGNGIRLAGAQIEFRRLIDRLNLPVLTTWRADDLLPEDHRLYCGRPGAIGQRGANFTQQNADLIMTIGARLDFGQIGFDRGNFAPRAKKVIVDVDPAEIRKLGVRIDLPIAADANVFLRALNRQVIGGRNNGQQRWLRQCLAWKKNYPVVTARQLKQKGKISTYAFIDILSALLTGRDVLVPDSSGAAAEVTQQAVKIKAGLRVLNTPGLGSMGFGLPAGIGACLASGRKRTIVVIGDGGLQLTIQELQTVARLKLPLKIFVLNNNGYASIQATQKRFFGGHLVCSDPASGLTLPDTCRIAAAYRIKAVRIASQKWLRAKLRAVLKARGPVVCELLIDPRQETRPRMSSYVKPDGSMASRPFEDLYPFLPRGEFKANMISKYAQ